MAKTKSTPPTALTPPAESTLPPVTTRSLRFQMNAYPDTKETLVVFETFTEEQSKRLSSVVTAGDYRYRFFTIDPSTPKQLGPEEQKYLGYCTALRAVCNSQHTGTWQPKLQTAAGAKQPRWIVVCPVCHLSQELLKLPQVGG